jgi:hypothetical protein
MLYMGVTPFAKTLYAVKDLIHVLMACRFLPDGMDQFWQADEGKPEIVVIP